MGLFSWFTLVEQKSRLLQEWNRVSFKTCCKQYLDMSEIEVCRLMTGNLLRFQRQPHSDYQRDRFLRDRTVMATKIPHIARTLNEKVPSTVPKAIRCIAALLSDQPRTADGEVDVCYNLGRQIGGQAQRHQRGQKK